jgi:hypothetical protein
MAGTGLAAQLAQELGEADLRTVLEVFRRDVQRLSRALAGDFAAGDASAFRRTCHTLAGAAGAVDATDLEKACRRGMTVAEAAMATLHGEIAACCAAALAELDAFLAALPPG